MNTDYNTIRKVGVLVASLIAAVFFLSASPRSHDNPVHTGPHHDAAEAAEAPHLAEGVAEAAIELQALADMHTLAVLQFGDFVDVPDSFGGTSQYSHHWHLAWLQIMHNGHVIRLYHITNEHNHADRRIAVCDDDGGSITGWEQVY